MDIKRNYYEDIELFKSNTILVWSILFLIFLVILPLLIQKYHLLGLSLYTVNLITIHPIVAIGLNILVGYTGQISMGHAGFFALGAFTTVILILRWSFPLWIALPVAGDAGERNKSHAASLGGTRGILAGSPDTTVLWTLELYHVA